MKKLLIVLCALVASAVAQAGMLYWQVGSGAKFGEEPISFGTLYDNSGKSYDTVDVGKGVAITDVAKDASFYVEFFNYSGDSIAISETKSYADLLSDGCITDSTLSVTAMKAWMPPPAAAPEPTSAMLMMMGVAFLGLKRRKA